MFHHLLTLALAVALALSLADLAPAEHERTHDHEERIDALDRARRSPAVRTTDGLREFTLESGAQAPRALATSKKTGERVVIAADRSSDPWVATTLTVVLDPN